MGVEAGGVDDTDITVEFKKARWNDVARENTARVIKTVNADVACIVEADNRIGLRRFDTALLRSRYPYEMLLDGNDQRGIDVGLLSKYPIGGVWTHMFDVQGRSKTFSRDCPEYEVILPSGRPLYVLCNHLKSKGYSSQKEGDARRKRQAAAVAAILEGYELKKDWVVVAGDLNDTPTSDRLSPLLSIPDLYSILELQFGNDMAKRWTYHYRSFEQIDYLLVSKPLKHRLRSAGVESRGIARLEELTKAEPSIRTETEYSTVRSWRSQASDHGAVWAEFEFLQQPRSQG